MCNGSTTDSDSVCKGSNPFRATRNPGLLTGIFSFPEYLLPAGRSAPRQKGRLQLQTALFDSEKFLVVRIGHQNILGHRGVEAFFDLVEIPALGQQLSLIHI